jgi:type I restriction enzyme S subunit
MPVKHKKRLLLFVRSSRKLWLPFSSTYIRKYAFFISGWLIVIVWSSSMVNHYLEQTAQAIFAELCSDGESALLSDILEVCYGKDHKKLGDGKIPCYGSGGIMRHVEKALYSSESVLIPRKGSLNNVLYINEPFWTVDCR